MRLTLLVGMPASGKTTWARRHPSLGVLLPDIRPRPDWWQQERQRRRVADAHLSAGQPIVVDGCNLSADVRSDWRRVAHRRQAACHLVLFDTPVAEAIARNTARPSPVGEQAMADYATRWPAAAAAALAERWHHVLIVRPGSAPAPMPDAGPPAHAPEQADAGHRRSRDW